jgi:biopolymer transport protein ExbD
MRIPTRGRQHGLRFNITPLIDVVFLLIIFFLAATHFVRSETFEPVELPEAVKAAEEEDEQPRRLVVTITADQKLHVGAREVDLPAVENMVLAGSERDAADFEVRIRADRNVPYRAVEPIMLSCARSGVTRVKFAVIQKSE